MKKSSRLAAVLLLIVFGMNYTADSIATRYAAEAQIAATKAWDYIVQGAGSGLVFLCIGLIARKPLVWPVCLWGAFEAWQRSVCRLARPIGGEVPEVPLFSGLCGVDFYWLGIVAAVMLAAHMLDKGDKNGMD